MAFTLPALFNPVLALLGLGVGIGALLGYVAKTFRMEGDPVVDRINDILPQTQCGQCGYPGCKPYAEAIAAGDAINKCPPGGDKTIHHLANLLNLKEIPLDESHGKEDIRKVAFIREAECIGCAKCIPACPVDAILGAPKFMHTVIESECTGCDLCIDPCPVDCIELVPAANTETVADKPDPGHQACINCGLCIDVCPVDILPHELYRACRGENYLQAQSLKLDHCIECRKCDVACPSLIPLVDYYHAAKLEILEDLQEKARADRAKRRFELHKLRSEKLDAEELKRRQKRAQLAREDRGKVSSENIQAALARVREKKKHQ